MLGVADNLLRLLNFCFLVICLAFISTLINTQKFHISRVNYCMFAAAYGIATDGLYGLLANFWEPLAWPLILFTLDFLNFAFTLTAGIVLAVGIRAHSCKNVRYRERNHIIQGSENRCRISQAATAFFFFSMGIFIAKMVMSGINLASNGAFTTASSKFGRRRRHGGGVGVPETSGVPSISQV
ncbi:Fhn1p KNAG_0B00800 [Huiozyma naganishii CBS 8797]|uniref:MARVEL domain-containing protein n=1 Tax=Huiozyma naganishii (strain ATCC MYA-139 / BCRC 22969 / CBS 8797 / KCTC 17520 / NBRC 10181 / NCYC 3082 / Yp74L-3) TaxID=1071383 RepID=J7RUM2_HUIN7|nr:hypothetical protein KNAG_0B00800 [Kazachstania naganishii CBS 8797]CCK68527.1 hypothetical protein KNAG_0B00800 [Kazachstania naganishii CBS 8797]